MPTDLPRLVPSTAPTDRVQVQDTQFATDVVGRYVCNTWDEATANGGVAFDAVVIGAGMFGAYCAEKMYRNANLRVLVLDAGPVLVTEHVQNLSRIGLNAAGLPTNVFGQVRPVFFNADDPGPRERVWGIPWRSAVPFPGLAYCLGGRSLYWGGWSPRLTKADLARWPQEIAAILQNPAGAACDPNPRPGDAPVDEYCRTERETGVIPAGDYISEALNQKLRMKLQQAYAAVPTVDGIEDAPLAVQAAPPASGLFSFDKWSSAPIFVDAVREDAQRPNWQRRLFFVPRVHVGRLRVTGGAVTGIEAWVDGQLRVLDIAPGCAVVLANGTIEATRLALESFPTPLMGRNLMAHLRTNTVVRIHRSALGLPLNEPLSAAAMLVRGSTPQGRYHLQVTAAALQGGSEDAMFRAIPDLDLLERTLASQKEDWVVMTLRGIGEMQGSRDPNQPKVTGASPSWVDLSDQTEPLPPFSTAPAAALRRAWVNLVTSDADKQLWQAMDDAALALARKLANDDPALIQVVQVQRDGLGTTHHEAGTLWMGATPADSVTDLEGRFHHVSNTYVAGPAVFPTLGSANPSLTALTLARRTAQAVLRRQLNPEASFVPLGSGGLDGWRYAGSGRFVELGGGIVEADGGPGILWYSRAQYEDFILRVDFRLSSGTDNSGVFIRFPDPAGDPSVPVQQGYEIQIDNTGFNPDTHQHGDALHATGAIYTLAPTSAQMPSVQQWHTFEVHAAGPKITVLLDGTQVSQLLDAKRSPRGFIGLQAHHAGSKVQFARLRIQDLKPAGIQPLKVAPGKALAPLAAGQQPPLAIPTPGEAPMKPILSRAR